jgi:hypothetical protein
VIWLSNRLTLGVPAFIRYAHNHVSDETLTTELMISSGATSLPAEVPNH